MPLCTECRARARYVVNGEQHGGNEITDYPPYGMDWGDTCGCCGNEANVTL